MQENFLSGFQFGMGVCVAMLLIACTVYLAVFGVAFLVRTIIDWFEARAKRKAREQRRVSAEEYKRRANEKPAPRITEVASIDQIFASSPIVTTKRNVGAHRG